MNIDADGRESLCGSLPLGLVIHAMSTRRCVTHRVCNEGQQNTTDNRFRATCLSVVKRHLRSLGRPITAHQAAQVSQSAFAAANTDTAQQSTIR